MGFGKIIKKMFNSEPAKEHPRITPDEMELMGYERENYIENVKRKLKAERIRRMKKSRQLSLWR